MFRTWVNAPDEDSDVATVLIAVFKGPLLSQSVFKIFAIIEQIWRQPSFLIRRGARGRRFLQ